MRIGRRCPNRRDSASRPTLDPPGAAAYDVEMRESALRITKTGLGGPPAVRRFGLTLIVATGFASAPAAIAQSRADSLALAALLSDTLARELAKNQDNEGAIVELPNPPAGTSWRAPAGGRGASIVVTPPAGRVEDPHWRTLVLQALMARHPEAMRPPADSAIATRVAVRGIRFIGDTAVATVQWDGCIPRLRGGRWWGNSMGYRMVRTHNGWAFDRRVPGIWVHGTCDAPPPRPFVIDSAPAPGIVLTLPDPPSGNGSPRIVDLVREPSGGIYVAFTGRGVGRFSLDGAPSRELTDSAGRPAIGDRLAWAADTLWVTEASATDSDSRPTWLLFDHDGRFLGRRAFPDPEPGVEGVRPHQPLGNGRVIAHHPSLPDPNRVSIPAMVIADGHRVVRSLPLFVYGPKLDTIRDPWAGATREIRPPFRSQPLISISHDGTSTVTALAIQPTVLDRVGNLVWTATPVDTIKLRVYQTDALPVTELARVAFVDSLASEMAARAGRPVTAEVRAAIRASLTFPAFHATATDLLAGEDGSIWIRLPTEGPTAIWLHAGPDGRERGRVVLPADFRALYADSNDLWGSARAANGGAQLVRYLGLARPR